MKLPAKCSKWEIPSDATHFVRGSDDLDPRVENTACCDFCTNVSKLVPRVIGQEFRAKTGRFRATYEVQSNFFSLWAFCMSQREDMQNESISFKIYTHPATSCPWDIMKPYPYLSLEFADSQIINCFHHHNCIPSDHNLPPLPTRVISVGREPRDIRLVEARTSRDRYICLSHCWGSQKPLITTKSNLQNHLRCIPWDTIPPLYQDTIRLAWRYGVKYVWIDSICIVQDDLGDWGHEAGRMGDVYGNSFLTVAATANADCCSSILDGLTGDCASLNSCLSWGGLTSTGQPFRWIVVPDSFLQDDHCYACEIYPNASDWTGRCLAPLNRRAWALQERILSPRVLSFSARKLAWKCRECSLSEDGTAAVSHMDTVSQDDAPLNSHRPSSSLLDFLGHNWLDLVQVYSKLVITKEHDRLPALSGLARAYQTRVPTSTYVAGVWDNELLPSLAWYRIEQDSVGGAPVTHGKPDPISEPGQSTELPWYTPSWSWASVGSGVEFKRSQGQQFHSSVIGVICLPSSALDPFGNVKYGQLEICGPSSAIDTSSGDVVLRSFSKPTSTVFYWDRETEDRNDFQIIAESNIECLILHTDNMPEWSPHLGTSTSGLLLEPLDSKRSTYRRVGMIDLFYGISSSRRFPWSANKRKRLTIV